MLLDEVRSGGFGDLGPGDGGSGVAEAVLSDSRFRELESCRTLLVVRGECATGAEGGSSPIVAVRRGVRGCVDCLGLYRGFSVV